MKKLNFKKSTIANLENSDLRNVKGGVESNGCTNGCNPNWTKGPANCGHTEWCPMPIGRRF